jgi:hypothetical protein
MLTVARDARRAVGGVASLGQAVDSTFAARGPLALAGVLVVALVWLVPAAAFAHPLIDEGMRRYDEADFPAALAAFARAEQATDLTRDDLVQLYLRRAMVHQAMRNTEDREADLFRLASLERALTLPRAVSPPVRAAYAQAAQRVTSPMRLDVEVQPIPSGLKLVVRVVEDSAALVQALRIRARIRGGAWQRADSASIEVPAPAGSTVEYVAEGVGPGGALIVFAGTDATPLSATSSGSPVAETSNADLSPRAAADAMSSTTGATSGADLAADSADSGGVGPWPWIIGGSVVVVAAAVVLVVLLSASPGAQQVGGPVVTF